MLPSSHQLGLSVTDLTPNSPESAKFYDDNSIFSPDSNQIFEHANIYDDDEIYSISGINEITDMGGYCNNSSGANVVNVDGSASQHSFSDIADDDSELFHHHHRHHHHVDIEDTKVFHHHHDDAIVFDDVVVNSSDECGGTVVCSDSNGRLHSYDFESTNIDVILTSNDANLNSASRSTTTKLPQFLHLHNSSLHNSNSNLQQSTNNIGGTNGISTNNNGGSNVSINNGGGGVIVGDASDVCNGGVLNNGQYLITNGANINTIFASLNAVLTNTADYINNDMLMEMDEFPNYDITDTASSPGSHLEFDCSSEDLHQIQSTMYISDIKTEQ